MKPLFHLFIASVASLFQGCSTPVLVLDQSGKPISGARIEPVSASVNYAPVISDEEGKATIPWHLQQVEWINVSKEGYQPKSDIKIRPSGPITVGLRR